MNQDTRVQSKTQEIFIKAHEHECVFLGLNLGSGSSRIFVRGRSIAGFSSLDHAPQELPEVHWLCKDCSGRTHLHCWATSSTQPGLQGCQVWTYQLLQVCIIRADAIKASILYFSPPARLLLLWVQNFLTFKKVCDATPQTGPGQFPP